MKIMKSRFIVDVFVACGVVLAVFAVVSNRMYGYVCTSDYCTTSCSNLKLEKCALAQYEGFCTDVIPNICNSACHCGPTVPINNPGALARCGCYDSAK